MGKTKEKEIKPEDNNLERVLTAINSVLDNQKVFRERIDSIEKKIQRFETGKDERFKDEAKPEDIKIAKSSREEVDPRVVKIVDEMLGEDFPISLKSEKGIAGLNFTITVPERLSLLPIAIRPIKNLATGEYVKDEKGKTVTEEYRLSDNRTKIIASTDSFDAIRNHCEKVRVNIVATYQKLSKPLPIFQLKTYVR